jgi:hypothetical protein
MMDNDKFISDLIPLVKDWDASREEYSTLLKSHKGFGVNKKEMEDLRFLIGTESNKILCKCLELLNVENPITTKGTK